MHAFLHVCERTASPPARPLRCAYVRRPGPKLRHPSRGVTRSPVGTMVHMPTKHVRRRLTNRTRTHDQGSHACKHTHTRAHARMRTCARMHARMHTHTHSQNHAHNHAFKQKRITGQPSAGQVWCGRMAAAMPMEPSASTKFSCPHHALGSFVRTRAEYGTTRHHLE